MNTRAWIIGAALAGALACAGARAQAPVTERQAQTYIRGGFLTDAAPAILSKDVKLGAELERQLALPPGADSRAIYDALVALVDPNDLAVRPAGADGESKQPLFKLESGDLALLIRYDLQANNIAFIERTESSPKPLAAAKPAPPAAAAVVTPKVTAVPPAPRSGLRIPGLTPYKIDIQQGNNVSAEALSRLQLGMSREQVRALLGTPLLTDIFHGDRWDYVYFREHPDGKRESRKLVVFFESGKLARFDGNIAAPKAAK